MSDVDDLAPSRVTELLRTQRYGRPLEVRQSTASTNDDVREALRTGAADGYTIVADSQTRGRGARGAVWHSPKGQDLYLSIAARTGLPLTALPPLTLAIGVAVAETVDRFSTASSAKVKWPNDVLLEGRKIAGILVETLIVDDATHPAAVIGIGLNVGRRSFPDDLEYPATSLSLCLGAPPPPRAEVLAYLLERTERWVDRLVHDGPLDVVAAVNARLALVGTRVTADGVQGEVLGVASDGRLRLSTEQGEHLVVGGRLRPA